MISMIQMPDIQSVLVGIIILGALYATGRKFAAKFRTQKAGPSCNCGCTDCPLKKDSCGHSPHE